MKEVEPKLEVVFKASPILRDVIEKQIKDGLQSCEQSNSQGITGRSTFLLVQQKLFTFSIIVFFIVLVAVVLVTKIFMIQHAFHQWEIVRIFQIVVIPDVINFV